MTRESEFREHTYIKNMLTCSLLNEINIKAAMNSGTDILGEFYEVFLKYGNDAKDIGIVLTPRHITKFACDVLDIDKSMGLKFYPKNRLRINR